MSPAPADAKIRSEALDPGRSFILESPAGSGKTALLTARYLALLARVVNPRQILAVTFTNRAAAEMLDRIMGVLKRALRGETPTGDGSWKDTLLALALDAVSAHRPMGDSLLSPDTLMVSTFHGFCARVVRSWPLEADVPPGLRLLEPVEQDELLAACVSDALAAAAAGAATSEELAAFRRRLAAADNSVRTLREQLLDLLKRRDRLLMVGSLFAAEGADGFADTLASRTDRLAASFMKPLEEYFSARAGAWGDLKEALDSAGVPMAERIPAAVPGTGVSQVAAWRAAAEVFLTGSADKSPSARSVRQSMAHGNGFPDGFKKHPASALIRELPPSVASRLAFVASWPDAGADGAGAAALADMVCLAGAVLSRFRRARNARGLDFTELEASALRALNRFERPSESLIFFHEHLRHVLVDEAQDVNDMQVRILGALTQGWEPHGTETLFVVGDPKQSIYRFRRAEVALFRRMQRTGLAREGEASFPLHALRLSANFRSKPHLVAFANALFGKVMADPDETLDEVSFAPSEPSREASDAPSPVLAALFTCASGRSGAEDRPTRAQAREKEAAFVAARAANLLARGVAGDRVAVLIPARTHLAAFVAAFESLRVPLRIKEGRPMLDAPEVRHLLNLFRALVRPYDDVAWAGALRAPWSRVPLAALEALAARSPGPWSARLREAEDAHPALERFGQALRRAAPAFGREPFAATLQRVWEELGGPAVTVGLSGPQGIANAMALFDRLLTCPASPTEEALARLECLLGGAYTPPDPKGAASGVQVMTIHGAKGLEFDHVFAVAMDYQPARNRRETPAFLVDLIPGHARDALAAATADRRTGEKVLAHVLLRELGRGRDGAEFKRQFYVAATRAKETLTLTGLDERLKDGSPSASSGPGLAAVEEAWEEGLVRPPLFVLEHDPCPDAAAPSAVLLDRPLPQPTPFAPQPLPYVITSPSEVEEETAQAARPGDDEASPEAQARGVVMHRVFETLARREPMPSANAVAAALVEEQLALSLARAMAGDLLQEAHLAWNFPPFHRLLEGAEVVAEWPLEDYDGKGRLRVGRVDLLVRSSSGIVIVDFKTGRPAGGLSEWIEAQRKAYSGQLKAYVGMARRAGLESGLRAALLFTAIPDLSWLDSASAEPFP